MAGKKRLRTTLSSAEKRKKNESDAFRSFTQVLLLEQKERWDRLEAVLKATSDRMVAEVLLGT